MKIYIHIHLYSIQPNRFTIKFHIYKSLFLIWSTKLTLIQLLNDAVKFNIEVHRFQGIMAKQFLDIFGTQKQSYIMIDEYCIRRRYICCREKDKVLSLLKEKINVTKKLKVLLQSRWYIVGKRIFPIYIYAYIN